MLTKPASKDVLAHSLQKRNRLSASSAAPALHVSCLGARAAARISIRPPCAHALFIATAVAARARLVIKLTLRITRNIFSGMHPWRGATGIQLSCSPVTTRLSVLPLDQTTLETRATQMRKRKLALFSPESCCCSSTAPAPKTAAAEMICDAISTGLPKLRATTTGRLWRCRNGVRMRTDWRAKDEVEATQALLVVLDLIFADGFNITIVCWCQVAKLLRY
jgi:hypothetical protein